MNEKFLKLAIILILTMATTAAVTAQDFDVTANNATLNNTTMDNNISENMTSSAMDQTIQKSTFVNDSKDSAFIISAASHTAQNLSTAGSLPILSAPISEMASAAPLVAAGASSIQVASETAGSFKIGNGVGGSDPFNPENMQIEIMKLGIPVKPIRDTGKMFFICNIV